MTIIILNAISRVISIQISLFFFLALLCSGSHAASIRQLQIDDMVSTAALVFEGTVVSRESRWDAQGAFINTYVTFEISDVVIGDYTEEQLELRFSGGQVGDAVINVEGLRYPELGEKGIYFVRTLSEDQINPLLGWDQGHFLIKPDAAGVERVVTARNASVMALTMSSTNNASAKDTAGAGQPISNGVATGVSTAKQGIGLAVGMTKSAFKQALRQQ